MTSSHLEPISQEWIQKYQKALLYNRSAFQRTPKLLILDIDGTLVAEGEIQRPRTFPLRPGLQAFFQIAQQLNYTFAIWSAAPSPHVSDMVKKIKSQVGENNLSFAFVWSQDACRVKNSYIVKPLSLVYLRQPAFTIANTLILDNTPRTYSENIKNAIPIPTFTGTETDQELLHTLALLSRLSETTDVRPSLTRFLSLT